MPPAEQATIARTLTYAVREYADVRGACCICGSDSDQDQMIWCSAPSLDTPGLKGRELCGRGVHFHCLNYNLRFNIRDLRRLRNSCFCSRDCQFRGTHLKLRGITNVDKPDIVFGLVAEPKPWMHVFSVATTVLAQKMTSDQLRQITQDRLAAGLAIDNVRAALEEKSVASSVSTPPEERKKRNKGYHTRFETGYTLEAGQIKETRRSTEEAAGNAKVPAKASLAPSTLTHATGETDAAVPLGLPHAPYPSDIFLPPKDDECEGDDMADASTVTREVYLDLLTQLKEDAAMCVDIVPGVARDEPPALGVRDATIESDALAVSAVEESSVRLVGAPAATLRPAGASPVDGAARAMDVSARAMDVSAPTLHPAECKSTTPNRCLRAAADDAVAATGSDAVPSHDHPLISNDARVDVTGSEPTKRLQPDEPADSSDDDVERRPARRAVHFADTVDGDALASTSQPLVAPSSDASGSDDDSDKNDGRDGAVEHDDGDDEDYVDEEACEAKATADGPTPEHPPADDDAGWETCESDVEEVEPKRRTCIRWTDDEHERLIQAVKRFKAKKWKQIAAAVGTRTESQCCMHFHANIMNIKTDYEKAKNESFNATFGMYKAEHEQAVEWFENRRKKVTVSDFKRVTKKSMKRLAARAQVKARRAETRARMQRAFAALPPDVRSELGDSPMKPRTLVEISPRFREFVEEYEDLLARVAAFGRPNTPELEEAMRIIRARIDKWTTPPEFVPIHKLSLEEHRAAIVSYFGSIRRKQNSPGSGRHDEALRGLDELLYGTNLGVMQRYVLEEFKEAAAENELWSYYLNRQKAYEDAVVVEIGRAHV